MIDLVNEEIKAGIPSERIFIGGFSQGGATALYAAMTAPLKFAGVIALSTWMPLAKEIPAKLQKVDGKLQMPVFQGHGDADQLVSLDWGNMTVQLMQSLGFSNVTFKKYRGVGHSCGDDVSNLCNNILDINVFPFFSLFVFCFRFIGVGRRRRVHQEKRTLILIRINQSDVATIRLTYKISN